MSLIFLIQQLPKATLTFPEHKLDSSIPNNEQLSQFHYLPWLDKNISVFSNPIVITSDFEKISHMTPKFSASSQGYQVTPKKSDSLGDIMVSHSVGDIVVTSVGKFLRDNVPHHPAE